MDDDTRKMHLYAGRMYGIDSTCGTQIDYKTECRASDSAIKMGEKVGRLLEPYPCYWCSGWHIGRSLTEPERVRFLAAATQSPPSG